MKNRDKHIKLDVIILINFFGHNLKFDFLHIIKLVLFIIKGDFMSGFNFGILGGDYRYKFFYEMLRSDGYNVKVLNNKFLDENEDNLQDLLKDIDILIAPVPFTKNNETIFTPDFEEIAIKDLLREMYKNNVKVLAGGIISEIVLKEASEYDIDIFDFFEQEAVAVLNAIPTAEGAVQTAMEESVRTIFGSKALVLGYGRCGKILSNMLKGIGAEVTVTHRNEKDCSYIKSFGLKEVNLYEMRSRLKEFDFIFNTIPFCVLDKETLKRINKNTIIIDLAQAPGGLDYNFARDLNLKALYCPSLPGRVAPYTAGKILKDALLNYCFSNL